MKTCIKILCFWLCGCVVAIAQLPTNGLVAHYDFNRDVRKDSTRIYDQSSNRNHGTVLGTVLYTPDRFGVPCSAL